MRNKELIAEMREEIDALKEKTNKLQQVADWLECHDRNDIDFDCVIHHYFPCRIIRYFYKGEIKTAQFGYGDVEQLPKLVRNGEQTIVVCDECRNKYFQIDKATATVTEIPKPEIVDDSVGKQSSLEKRIDCIESNVGFLWKAHLENDNKINQIRSQIKCQENREDETVQFVGNLADVVEFTNLYGADSIHFELLSKKIVKVSYLFSNKKRVKTYSFNGIPMCVKNDSDIAILECNEKYYQLDKELNTIVEIPKPAFVAEKKSKSKNGEKDNEKTSA